MDIRIPLFDGRTLLDAVTPSEPVSHLASRDADARETADARGTGAGAAGP